MNQWLLFTLILTVAGILYPITRKLSDLFDKHYYAAYYAEEDKAEHQEQIEIKTAIKDAKDEGV
jgi:hypothetical protein